MVEAWSPLNTRYLGRYLEVLRHLMEVSEPWLPPPLTVKSAQPSSSSWTKYEWTNEALRTGSQSSNSRAAPGRPSFYCTWTPNPPQLIEPQWMTQFNPAYDEVGLNSPPDNLRYIHTYLHISIAAHRIAFHPPHITQIELYSAWNRISTTSHSGHNQTRLRILHSSLQLLLSNSPYTSTISRAP